MALPEGVYCWFSGNMGAGLSDEAISHEHTKAMAPLGAAKLEHVLRRFLKSGAGG